MGSGRSKVQVDHTDQISKHKQPVNEANEEDCSDIDGAPEYEYEKDVDSDSVDSANSDDTYGLARRIPQYIAINCGEIHDDAIEIIAEENRNMYESVPGHDATSIILEDDPEGEDQLENESNTFEKDTIGYYISKSNNENRNAHNNEQVDVIPEDDGVETKLEDDSSKKKDKDALYEEFNLNYSSRSRRVKKRTISNKQTLILTKVNNRYKYITVPAYLPGQRVYSSRSFVKNYMTSPQYVYRRGRNSKKNTESVSFIRRFEPIQTSTAMSSFSDVTPEPPGSLESLSP